MFWDALQCTGQPVKASVRWSLPGLLRILTAAKNTVPSQHSHCGGSSIVLVALVTSQTAILALKTCFLAAASWYRASGTTHWEEGPGHCGKKTSLPDEMWQNDQPSWWNVAKWPAFLKKCGKMTSLPEEKSHHLVFNVSPFSEISKGREKICTAKTNKHHFWLKPTCSILKTFRRHLKSIPWYTVW